MTSFRLCLLPLTLLFSSLSLANRQMQDFESNHKLTSIMHPTLPSDISPLSVVLSYKGFMKGFQMGLYNDAFFKLSEDCFNPDVIGPDMQFIYDFINGRQSPTKTLKFVGTTKTLIMSEMDNCGHTQSLYNLQEWCRDEEVQEEQKEEEEEGVEVEKAPERCVKRQLVRTFYKRYFNFMGHYNKINYRYNNLHKNDNHMLYLDMLDIGREFGKGIRRLYAYEEEHPLE